MDCCVTLLRYNYSVTDGYPVTRGCLTNRCACVCPVYWSTPAAKTNCPLNINHLYIITDKLVVWESASKETGSVWKHVCVHYVWPFVCRALQHCLLTKYLRGVVWALETVFASCCSRCTYCLTKCWNTEESAGCSQWPRVKKLRRDLLSWQKKTRHSHSSVTKCLIQRETLINY